jgi:hypothetical protein
MAAYASRGIATRFTPTVADALAVRVPEGDPATTARM